MVKKSEIFNAEKELNQAWERFNSADQELIDSAIYSIKSAELRYDSVIRRAKLEGVTNDIKKNGKIAC